MSNQTQSWKQQTRNLYKGPAKRLKFIYTHMKRGRNEFFFSHLFLGTKCVIFHPNAHMGTCACTQPHIHICTLLHTHSYTQVMDKEAVCWLEECGTWVVMGSDIFPCHLRLTMCCLLNLLRMKGHFGYMFKWFLVCLFVPGSQEMREQSYDRKRGHGVHR